MSENTHIISEAKRLENVKFSAVRKVMAEMNELKEQGFDIIPFQIGEPDYITPRSIIDSTLQALSNELTHYAPNRGSINLRNKISELLASKGLGYDPETEILVTVSGAEAINNALLAVINEGDEVIVPTPAYMNYKNVIHMAGGVFVELPLKLEEGFQINTDALEKLITDKTKMLIINNPNNPTGIVFSDEVLQKVALLARKHNLIVFSDEIYDENVYEGVTCTSIASFNGMRDRTIVMNGFSKAYAMTGWRLGYIAATAPIINMCLKVHQYTTTCAPTFIQEGVASAMLSEQCVKEKQEIVEAFSRKRTLILQKLNEIPQLDYAVPFGAFYVFIDVSKTGLSGMEFVHRLLHEKYVAVVPGMGFSSEGQNFIRISFATSEKNIVDGFRRIKEFIDSL